MASYAQVSTREDDHPLAENLTLASRKTTYTQIEEARGLTWSDPFYDGKHGIVVAFDRDAEGAGRQFFWKFMRVGIAFGVFGALYWIMGSVEKPYSEEAAMVDDFAGVYMWVFTGLFAIMAVRGRQTMLNQHVAVTTEGVRIDNGSMMAVTIPLEHIKTVKVFVPKICCRLINTGLSSVAIERTAAPLEQLCFRKTSQMELYGIIRAAEFVELVKAMKESQEGGTFDESLSRVELQTI